MSLEYNVYWNGGSAGVIDASTIVLTTTSLFAAVPALGTPSDNSFLVRTFDTVTGFEDLNRDRTVRIVIDAAGNDITDVPNPPIHLTAVPTANASLLVSWAYFDINQAGAPTGFKVWVTVGTTPNYSSSPAVIVGYIDDENQFQVTIIGLTDATQYAVAVRSTNATGDDTNTDFVLVYADASGPSPVLNLSGSVGFAIP